MGQEEWASLQHALQLLAAHFLSDELSVFVLLNFVTSMYALGAFITKVCTAVTLTLTMTPQSVPAYSRAWLCFRLECQDVALQTHLHACNVRYISVWLHAYPRLLPIEH
jgi:hypothetical protein